MAASHPSLQGARHLTQPHLYAKKRNCRLQFYRRTQDAMDEFDVVHWTDDFNVWAA